MDNYTDTSKEENHFNNMIYLSLNIVDKFNEYNHILLYPTNNRLFISYYQDY